MAFLVTLYSQIDPAKRPAGVPLDAPGKTDENVPDDTVPGTDQFLFKTAAEANEFCRNGPHKAEYDAWEETYFLPDSRKKAFEQIDLRTEQVIARGFTFGGKVLSLSASAQLNLTNALIARALLEYPIRWNALNDADGTVDIKDADSVLALYEAALVTKRAALDSGTVLKDAIRAAATQAEIDAVEDDR